MAFRSIFDHVTSVCKLSTLKNRLTTCFSNWRRKIVQQQHQLPKVKVHRKDFVQFKNLVSPIKQHEVDRDTEDSSFEKLQTVAKFLASTLTAATITSTTTTASVLHYAKVEEHLVEAEESMAITEDSILEIRNDFPDLDSEIRSILLARVQEGATVSEIKEDYYVLTGEKFPIQKGITQYLLSIPSVYVYCNGQGTLIFNVKANEKTQHLYDLVIQQKPSTKDGLHNSNEKLNEQPSSGWRRVTQNDEESNVQPSFGGRGNDLRSRCVQPQRNDSNNNNNEGYDNNNHFTSAYFIHRQAMWQTQLQTKLPARLQVQPSSIGNIQPQNYGRANNSYLNNRNYIYNRIYQLAKPTQENDSTQNHNYSNNKNNRKECSNYCGIGEKRSSFSSSHRLPCFYPLYSDYQAHLWDFALLGDDFLMYLARMELHCKFNRNQTVLQSGMCISGQTIGDAIRNVRQINHRREHIIVNIGSVDIMQEKPLIQIEHQFQELIDALQGMGATPILTTLGPLANYSHLAHVNSKLQRFNEFIKKEAEDRSLQVIDVWSRLVDGLGRPLFDCFQKESRWVTGSSKRHQFWNKVGRLRVLQLIESSLEY